MSCLSVGRRFYGRDLASPELRTEGSRIPRPLLLRGLRGARAPLRKRGAKRRAVRERGQRLPVGTAASYSEPPGELSRGRRLAERAKKQWRRTSGSPPARSGECVKGGISPGRTVQRPAFRRRLAERAKKTMAANFRFAASAIGGMGARGDFPRENCPESGVQTALGRARQKNNGGEPPVRRQRDRGNV